MGLLVVLALALSAADEQATFKLQSGFRAELVASEPMVQDPVALTFDEEGRIWVVEMRGFMPDVAGTGENEPVGRITILEDTDDDGRADRRTVFLDHLVMPRAIAVTRGGALVVHGNKLWMAHDRDGDGRADNQSLIDPTYMHGGNPEHQANGLLRAMDNWIYSAKSTTRYRRDGERWKKDQTEFRGQWGMTQDDLGRLFYNYNYDQLRADLVPPNAISRNPHNPTTRGINVQVTVDQRVFPAHPTPAVNRGYRPNTLDEKGRLRAVTSASAPLVYRGDLFPAEFRGNVFVCEPAGNLIKRNIVKLVGLRFETVFPYEDLDFFTSTDERFRPVNAHLGPDGAIYVADMYRGIIQHREYITPYLRQQIQSRHLDRPVHLGRIWRVVGPEGRRRGMKPHLGAATDAQLVATLSHANGWWRDTAQRLLVERKARAAIPALLTIALQGKDPLARVHALWTLEALRPGRPERLLSLIKEEDPAVKVAAIRVLESLQVKGLVQSLESLPPSAPPQVLLQVALTLGRFTRGAQGIPVLARIMVAQGADPLVRDAVLSGLAGRELEFLELLLLHVRDETLAPAIQAVASAVVRQAQPVRVERLLALAGNQSGDSMWRARAMLGGLVENMVHLEAKPLRLPRAPAVLDRLERDARLASLVGRARPLLAWPGHEPPAAPTVDRSRKPETADMRTGRETYLASCAPCHGQRGEGIEPMAPPLVGSEWVRGSSERLIRIVLFGMEGPIHVRGEKYEPPRIMPNMPAVEGFVDDVLADTLTYVRSVFGRGATEVETSQVRSVRDETAKRDAPYTEEELLKIK